MKFGKNQRWKQCWCYGSCWKLFDQALRGTFSLDHEWSLTFLRDKKRAKYTNAWKLPPARHLLREWGFSRALAYRSLINYSAIFSYENKVQWSFPGCLFFSNTRKNCKINLVLVVVLVLESKVSIYYRQKTSSLTTWFHSFVRVWLTENWTSVAYCEWKKSCYYTQREWDKKKQWKNEQEEEIKFHMSTSLQSKFRTWKVSESLQQFQLWLSLYKQPFIDLLLRRLPE